MARTINEIKAAIVSDAQAKLPDLSPSKTAEWNLWAYITAAAIHSFEVIMDLFRKEIDQLTNKITPGTLRWYAEMCKRFQNGDSLVFDPKTALLYYPKEDPDRRIIEVVAVSESHTEANKLYIKVAKKDDKGKIVELDRDELYHFSNYIDAIKFVGCQTEIISTKPDLIRYRLIVYHHPSIAAKTITENVRKVLDGFKTQIDFDGVVYRQKFLDAVMTVDGVVTCELNEFSRKSNQNDAGYTPIDIHVELDAGYFEYADEEDAQCVIETKSVNDLLKNER